MLWVMVFVVGPLAWVRRVIDQVRERPLLRHPAAPPPNWERQGFQVVR